MTCSVSLARFSRSLLFFGLLMAFCALPNAGLAQTTTSDPAQAQPVAAQAPPAAAQAPPAAPPPALPWYQQITFGGMVSTSWEHNFNSPASRTNQFRIFDTDSGSFNLDVADLVVERTISDPGQVGFRVEVLVGGLVPKVTAAAGLFRDAQGKAGDLDVLQAYLGYIAPIGRGLRIDVGKFATHVGYEIVEGRDGYNDNHTHSFLFGYAEPITHTGVRFSYPLSEQVSAKLLVVNGWDDVRDNNSGKSVGAQLALTPSPRLSVYANYIGGPEQPDNNSDLRHAFDLVAIAKAGPSLTLSLNGDYGRESRVPLAATAGGGVRDATWGGVAGYARYAFSERFALVVRGEWFDDPQGARTGYAQTLNEITLTPEYRPHPHLVVRGDLRRDQSNRAVFELSDGAFGTTQVTVSVNALVVF